jgi:hypothetical protein
MPLAAVKGIHRTSRESLVQYINDVNNTNLKVDQLIFGLPGVIAGTWREDATDRNTIIRITATEDSPYRDTTLVVYDRLDTGKLNSLLDFKVKTYMPETTHDLLKPVFLRYGIFLDVEDFVDEPLVNVEPDPEATPIYTLKAREDAVGWVGECRIVVGEGNAVLGDYLTVETLLGLDYPVEGDGSSGSAIVYMYGYDFTPVKEVLESYPEEYIIDEFSEDLLAAIKQIDVNEGDDLWNLDPLSTEWSLHGAEVVYNGINDATLPTNNSYKYVMGIKLRGDITIPPGVMYLHYNDPFDPNEI